MKIVLIFFHYIANYIFLVFWSFVVNSLFYQKTESGTFASGQALCQIKKKTETLCVVTIAMIFPTLPLSW